jgi:hypothetical protein
MFTTCHFLWRHAFVVLESFVAGGVRMFLKFFTSFSAVIACAESLARFQIWSSKLDPLVSTKSKKINKIDGKPFQI